MDSGNSGSIQSSSGGDEEYDSSRADSLSAFAHLSNPTAPPSQPHHHHHHHHNSNLFDPLPNYFDPNPLSNFDPIWSKSPINCTYNSLPLPSSSSSGAAALFTSSSSSPTVPFDPPKTDPVQARNPKKRSRASRRAPTTVLTTDTTNFRAMVQEFTGIPAPPFTSSSSPFVRNRLDLFGAPSSARSFPLSDALQPPPYLLRPFAQKFQPPPPPFNSNDGNSTGGSNSNSNSVNYQMQNQILTFQSLLQSPMANPSVTLRSSGQDFLEIPSGNNDDVIPTVWGGGVGLNGGDQSHHLRPVNGSYVDYSQSGGGGGGGKGNYEKGSENVGAGRGGGGMVESWICSSDH